MTRRAVGAASGDLFEIPQPVTPLPGSLDFRPVVSELISTMLAEAHKAGLDRHEVAARASRISGKDITKNMLDGYTAPAREEFNCPLWLSPVLEIVCCSTALANWHAGVHGGRLSGGGGNPGCGNRARHARARRGRQPFARPQRAAAEGAVMNLRDVPLDLLDEMRAVIDTAIVEGTAIGFALSVVNGVGIAAAEGSSPSLASREVCDG